MAGKKVILLSVLFTLFVIVYEGLLFYTEVAWFRETGYLSAFRTRVLTRLFLFCVFGAAFFAFSYVNYFFARKVLESRGYTFDEIRNLHATENFRAFLKMLVHVVFLVFGIMFAFDASFRVNAMLLFLHPQSFGVTDPVFHRDAGYFVFRLPFLKYAVFYCLFLFTTNFFVALFIYFYTVGGRLLMKSRAMDIADLQFPRRAKTHLHILGSLILFCLSLSLRLRSYEILFSKRGVVYGAGYADVHGTLPVLNAFVVLLFILALFSLANIYFNKVRLLIAAAAACGILYALAGGYPGFLQQFAVLPSEIQKEKPYMQNNIEFTRYGFNLNNVREKQLDITATEIPQNELKYEAVLDQTRVWDYRVLLSSFMQLQSVRLYYTFQNVDVDRYTLNGKVYQVMLSAREFSEDNLEPRARTWVNRHLKYTHGYGVSMVYADRFTKEGMPEFIVSNIPPRSPYFTFKNPRIYFGESNSSYAVVNTKEPEFDYPGKDRNKETTYMGHAGIPLSGTLMKAAFALRLGDMNLFISQSVTKDSRILLYRNIIARIRKIAPFIALDPDPYIVALPGRSYWLVDGYTTTAYFPYSERLDLLPLDILTGNRFANYIRNSVKVTVDAYDGTVKFYIADPSDPVILSYARIYPGVFRPLSEMPVELQAHLRYPERLFLAQSRMFSIYHMNNTETFYNKEDAWQVAQEIVEEGEQPMEPYYVLARLPGEDKKEYILMQPFTPSGRGNMIAWLAGRCNEKQKCGLVLYRFPKQRNIYGPAQIEARINQDQEISKILTLWNQRGSRVRRGNLLVIPTSKMLFYVKPVYLLAESSELPELKMVVVSNGKYLAMGSSLRNAFDNLIKVSQEDQVAEAGKNEALQPLKNISGGTADEISRLLALYEAMQGRLKQGDLEGFGKLFKHYGDVLQSLKKSSAHVEK